MPKDAFPHRLEPTFDAGRKCLDRVEKNQNVLGSDLPGWRKLEDWSLQVRRAASQPDGLSQAQGQMRPTILLADDDLSVRESLRKLLQSEQYEVVLAVDGKEAVDRFLADPNQFDLILTDLNMPLRNGWASIDRLLEVNPLLPVILLTGMPNQRELAEASQVNALVEKPIDVPALLHLIRELLAEISQGQLHRLPRKETLFHYVRAYDGFSEHQQTYPYSHWGLNE